MAKTSLDDDKKGNDDDEDDSADSKAKAEVMDTQHHQTESTNDSTDNEGDEDDECDECDDVSIHLEAEDGIDTLEEKERQAENLRPVDYVVLNLQQCMHVSYYYADGWVDEIVSTIRITVPHHL